MIANHKKGLYGLLGPYHGPPMKTTVTTLLPAQERILRFPETTTETAVDTAILVKLFWAALAGVLSYIAAVFTTVLELGGFWQYFWLGICLATFACACFLIVLACRDFGNRSCFRGNCSAPNRPITSLRT
jgi:hypothetical protein